MMRVPLCRLVVPMAEELLDLIEIDAPLDKPGSEGMSQGVEAEAVDLSGLQSLHEVRPKIPAINLCPHGACKDIIACEVSYPGLRLQELPDGRVYRAGPPPAALRH